MRVALGMALQQGEGGFTPFGHFRCACGKARMHTALSQRVALGFYQAVSRVDEAAGLGVGGFPLSQVQLQVQTFF